MRMPWSKSGNLQLDLLDAPAAPEEAPAPPAARGAAAKIALDGADGQPLRRRQQPAHRDSPKPTSTNSRTTSASTASCSPSSFIGPTAKVVTRFTSAPSGGGPRSASACLKCRSSSGDGPTNPYAQVAENQKRHGLTPLDLARFIRGRIDAGDSNTTVAKALGLDLTTVAHHLALLDLPPVVDAAMKAGRCSSPRTLYELGKLHAAQPERVAELVAGADPITRDAVAEIRDTAAQAPAAASEEKPRTVRPSKAQLLARATGLCDKLDVTLMRLGKADLDALPIDDVAALRQRVVQLARRIDA